MSERNDMDLLRDGEDGHGILSCGAAERIRKRIEELEAENKRLLDVVEADITKRKAWWGWLEALNNEMD